jgi:hypothetical protein
MTTPETDALTFDVQIAGGPRRDRPQTGVGIHNTASAVVGEQARADLSPQSVPARSDRRYGSRRWRQTAKAVLRRDLYVCRIVEGCPVRASVADHVIPTYPGMPDSLFFGLGNLRAGCQGHNKARGFAPEVKPAGSTAVVTKDYSGG